MKPVENKLVLGKYFPFSLSLQPSCWLIGYLTLLHLLLLMVGFLLWGDSLSIDGMGLFFILLLLHWVLCLWRFTGLFTGYHYPYRVVKMTFRDQGWLLTLAGRRSSVDLIQAPLTQATLTQATVWPWLVVMNFRCLAEGRRYSVIVLPDSAGLDCRRRLRVLLRHLPVWG